MPSEPKEKLLLTQKEVRERLGFGKAKWAELQSEGKTPLPVNLEGRPRYSLRDVEEWIENLGHRKE